MKRRKFLAVALLPMALGGCGGDGLTATGSVTTSQLSAIAGTMNTFVNKLIADKDGSLAEDPSAMVGSTAVPIDFGSGPAISNYTACTEVTIDKNTDEDRDGIPVHVRNEADCRGVTIGTGTGDVTGYTELRDFNDNKVGDFRVSYGVKQLTFPDDLYDWNGTYELTSKGRDLITSSDIQLRVNIPSYRVKLDYTYRAQFDQTRTADDPSNPYKSGRMKFSGFYQFSGFLGENEDGQNLGNMNLVFKIEGEGLVYDDSCAQYFRSGSISFIDGGNNVYKTEFDCDATPVITFNGQPYDDN